tara:strand:+ start:1152 stop:1328 length:177 start_codon:yes stop_codon:yes gene_type:complete
VFRDKSYTEIGNINISRKQVDLLNKAANGVWYYQKYFRMAIFEDKMAGKLMSRRGLSK